MTVTSRKAALVDAAAAHGRICKSGTSNASTRRSAPGRRHHPPALHRVPPAGTVRRTRTDVDVILD